MLTARAGLRAAAVHAGPRTQNFLIGCINISVRASQP
jgi:hypothetical protein